MHVVYKIVRKAACRLAFNNFHVEILKMFFLTVAGTARRIIFLNRSLRTR